MKYIRRVLVIQNPCSVFFCLSQKRTTVTARHAYLFVGVGAPEDMWVTMASFMLVRGRGGLKQKYLFQLVI